MQCLGCDGKERHGVVFYTRKEQLAVSPHQICHNPQELHDVVNVVDQAALKAASERKHQINQKRSTQTLTWAVCQTKSSAMRTVGMENTIHVTFQLWFQLVSFASQKKMWTFSYVRQVGKQDFIQMRGWRCSSLNLHTMSLWGKAVMFRGRLTWRQHGGCS